jgi:hypothetical protein
MAATALVAAAADRLPLSLGSTTALLKALPLVGSLTSAAHGCQGRGCS